MGVQKNQQELTDEEEHQLRFGECRTLQDDIGDGELSQVGMTA